MRHLRFCSLTLLVFFSLGDVAFTQTDHLKCYKVKDPLRISADNAIDLDSPQLGLEPDCKIIKRFRLFCVPVDKTVKRMATRIGPGDFTPTELQPVLGQALTDDRVCYKIKCPEPFPPDVEVTDQFATRTLQKLKPFLLCTPANKGRCGNGGLDEGEDCDPPGPFCRGGCNPDLNICVDISCQQDCSCPDPRCGDFIIDTGEGCDDGNVVGGDGCSSECQREDG